jgi:hypothetical protein
VAGRPKRRARLAANNNPSRRRRSAGFTKAQLAVIQVLKSFGEGSEQSLDDVVYVLWEGRRQPWAETTWPKFYEEVSTLLASLGLKIEEGMVLVQLPDPYGSRYAPQPSYTPKERPELRRAKLLAARSPRKRKLREFYVSSPSAEYGPSWGAPLEAWYRRKMAEEEDGYPTYDHADGLRWADASDPHELVRYWQDVQDSCCGEVNEKLSIGKRTFWVGFNFGH